MIAGSLPRMDFLILSPPVTPPSEPPCGAFLLAAGLTARGFDAGLLDLSLELFHRELEDSPPATWSGINYLLQSYPYTPMHHRSVTGHLHRHLGRFEARHPGWRLTLMDIAAPSRVHDPVALKTHLETASPFASLWQEVLGPALDHLKPNKTLISLAYLSQLPATIDMVRFLMNRGITPIVGGSLPKSLVQTGHGIHSLEAVFPRISTGDGSALIQETGERLLDRLAWPRMVSENPYLSSRPIVPLTLSSGCFWNRCLFCPDRGLPFRSVPTAALEGFMATIPHTVMKRPPVIHLVDSAIPPGALRDFLPLSKAAGTDFFGFARPTKQLLRGGLLQEASDSGCLMLQLGAESGSRPLMDRYRKGLDPGEAGEVVAEASRQGILNYLYLLFGLPGETEADLRKTLDFVAQRAGHIDFLNLSLFNLPRFCELSEKADAFGIRIRDFPGEDDGIRLYWPFTSNGTDPRDQARRFLKRDFRAHPSIREITLRTPRWFRAAHLALMKPR